LSWVSTEIVRTKQRELEIGRSMTQFLKGLGLHTGGGRGRLPNSSVDGKSHSAGTIARMKRQIISLFGSRFILQNLTNPNGEGTQLLPIGDGMQLWLNHDQDLHHRLPSTLRVSEPFYEHVVRGPVPVDLRALRALKRSPMALDIYTWLTHRNFVMQNGGRAATMVPWASVQVQFGADYPLHSRGRADFKKAFYLAYRRVQSVYPDAQIRDEGSSLKLVQSRPHVRPRKLSAVQKREYGSGPDS
jgi:Plasmid encoded RepA protein